MVEPLLTFEAFAISLCVTHSDVILKENQKKKK